jgi:hypothetical protein
MKTQDMSEYCDKSGSEKRKTRGDRLTAGERRRRSSPECIHKQGIYVYVHSQVEVHRSGSLWNTLAFPYLRPMPDQNRLAHKPISVISTLKLCFCAARAREKTEARTRRRRRNRMQEQNASSWPDLDDESKSASSYNGVVIFNLC